MWIEQLPSGKYRYCERFKDPNTGKSKKISLVSSKKNDKANMSAKLYEAFQRTMDGHTGESDLTFQELSSMWLEVYAQTVKKSSSYNIGRRLAQINKVLGAIPLSKLTPQRINQYFLYCLQDLGNRRSTVAMNKSVIERALTFGLNYGYYTQANFKAQLTIPNINTTKKKEWKYLEREELKSVLDWLRENHGDEYYRLAYLQTNTGMRYNELVSLDYRQDIDLEHRTITIRRNYDPINHLYTTPKTGDARTIFISDAMVSLIREQIAHDQVKMLRGKLSRDNTLLFRSNRDQPISINTMNDKLRKIDFIPGKVISTHIFRHTFVTVMIENGIDPKLIAQHVGHSNTRMIEQVYAHFSDKMNQKLQEAVNAVHF